MEQDDPGHLELSLYREAAMGAVNNRFYKENAIHTFAEVHERVGEIAKRRLPPGAKIADFASGSGAMCLRLLDLGFSPTGCDLVKDNFRLHGKVPFQEINLNHSLPADMEGAFDGVVATDIIEHLENPRQFIRQCFRALRPGGLLILSTPNVDSPFSKALFIRTGHFHWFEDPEYRRGGHITPIPLRLLERSLTEAGFIEVTIESIVANRLPGIGWWRMRFATWLVSQMSGAMSPRGQTVIAEANSSVGLASSTEV